MHSTTSIKDANSIWIANKLLSIISVGPSISNKSFSMILDYKFGIKPHNMQLWRAMTKAKKFVEGNHKESFKKLSKYIHLLKQYNPGSYVYLGFNHNYNLDVHLPWKFQHIYVCLKAIKEGFVFGYRLFIGIDGCHLKGPCKDVLLSAMSLDENNILFYVAYVVVKCENNEICHRFVLYSFYGSIKHGIHQR